MTDAVITEFAGMRGGSATRIYQYTREGIRVLNGRRVLKRLYLFDPSSNMMMERDTSRQDKVLRRFVFDDYGMLEESFSFGLPPRTFRYENGGRQIVMREGGDYGAVGKTYTFEDNGISETAYGRNGEIERVFVFAPGNDTILIRRGGWYGDVDRTLVFEGIATSLFREPEAFLQFLMFTEQSHDEQEADVQEQVAKIRGEAPAAPGRSRFAYTGPRHASDDAGRADGIAGSRSPARPDLRSGARPAESPARRPSMQAGDSLDAGIDFIPEGDLAPRRIPSGNPAARDRSGGIPFEERWQSAQPDGEKLNQGGSSRISLDERFQSSRDEDRTLSEGRSARIPLEERFQSAEQDKEELTPGRSTRISYEERKTGRRLP
ncbi:MAG: hypothetical protein ABFC71_01375 [Methanoregula sp.]